ncbi:MAG: SurA N-terminal domain-containing protein, partial [Pyramidobacter sp.]|nr:SurA N-terminal domain-containing protein [Pyramidobacter sp.]
MLPLTALRTQIKWILAVFIIVFTASVGFMYGTGGSRSNNERSGDFVVAKINGEELHISVFQQHLRNFIERNRIRDLSDKQMPLIYKAVLDEMVSNRAVIDEVSRLKISVPAEDVNKQLKQVESQYVTREQFMQVLRNQGSSLEQAKAEIARQLSIEKMLNDVSGGVVVSDDEVVKL